MHWSGVSSLDSTRGRDEERMDIKMAPRRFEIGGATIEERKQQRTFVVGS